MTGIRFACIGECMIELSHQDNDSLKMSFAGDTLNMATYLARLSDPKQIQIEYITALGTDPYSEQMLTAWQAENIGHQLVRRLPNKLPGLYLIRTDAQGERVFYFYRSNSAARQVFADDAGTELCHQLKTFDAIFFSSIALAILDNHQREKLFQILKEIQKSKTQILFDTNYRSALWPSITETRKVVEEVLRYTDVVSASFEDEQAVFGDSDYTSCAKRIHQYGVKEIIIRLGEKGYYLSSPEIQEFVPVTPVKKVIDTTGAGDSFNGAYFAMRLQGKSMQTAAQIAAELAATVIQYRGAIIPKNAMPRIL